MNRYVAREWLTSDIKPSDFVAKLPSEFELEYDDGVVTTVTPKILRFSCFFWEFHKHYPTLPLL